MIGVVCGCGVVGVVVIVAWIVVVVDRNAGYVDVDVCLGVLFVDMMLLMLLIAFLRFMLLMLVLLMVLSVWHCGSLFTFIVYVHMYVGLSYMCSIVVLIMLVLRVLVLVLVLVAVLLRCIAIYVGGIDYDVIVAGIFVGVTVGVDDGVVVVGCAYVGIAGGSDVCVGIADVSGDVDGIVDVDVVDSGVSITVFVDIVCYGCA